jgi:hypothetical protein
VTISTRARFEVFKRDKFTCQYCGARAPQVELHLEHVRPRSAGGTNDMWNLLTACRDCNMGKLAVPLTIEQIHRIDGHIPNIVAQFMALAMECPSLNVPQRIFEISRGGRVFGDWAPELERLFDTICEESWALEDGAE